LGQENHSTVKLDLSVASCGMKTSTNFKENEFLSLEQPSEPKSLDVAWNIAGNYWKK